MPQAGAGKPPLPKEKIEQVLTRVTQPPKGRRRWSQLRISVIVFPSPIPSTSQD
jgi:hypothetical protein